MPVRSCLLAGLHRHQEDRIRVVQDVVGRSRLERGEGADPQVCREESEPVLGRSESTRGRDDERAVERCPA